MRLIAFTVALFLGVQTAQAEAIPGQSDPALTDAIARWLAEDDPIEALRDIGELAAGGNIAAQVFANAISYQTWTFPPDFQDRDAQRSLFPPTADDDRDRRFRPYRIDEATIPLFAARTVFASGSDVDEMAQALATIAEAGRLTEAFGFFMQANNQSGTSNPAYFEALEPFANASQRRVVEHWGLLHLEIARQAIPSLSESGFAEWPRSPEDMLRATGFFEALEAGQWMALISAAPFAGEPAHELAPWLDHPRLELVRTLWRAGANDAASVDDLTTLGEWIAADPAPYHDPLQRVCAAACGPDHLQCVGAGTLAYLNRSQILTTLEPLVSATQFYASPRADQELRLTIGYRQDEMMDGLPQCLRDAATTR